MKFDKLQKFLEIDHSRLTSIATNYDQVKNLYNTVDFVKILKRKYIPENFDLNARLTRKFKSKITSQWVTDNIFAKSKIKNPNSGKIDFYYYPLLSQEEKNNLFKLINDAKKDIVEEDQAKSKINNIKEVNMTLNDLMRSGNADMYNDYLMYSFKYKQMLNIKGISTDSNSYIFFLGDNAGKEDVHRIDYDSIDRNETITLYKVDDEI